MLVLIFHGLSSYNLALSTITRDILFTLVETLPTFCTRPYALLAYHSITPSFVAFFSSTNSLILELWLHARDILCSHNMT